METNEIAVKHLLTEYLENPLGIDARKPRLSWQIASPRRGCMQGAYQIQAAADAAQFASAAGLLWDTGKVSSDNTQGIPYQGPALASRQRVYWRARVWDQDDRQSAWSEPAWWEMGLLEEHEWTANWIEVDWEENPKAFKPSPFFRRDFSLAQPIKSARLYITSHGLYEAWLNGQRVGDQVFSPGYTAYDKRLQYQVYDVTSLLKQGENALGAILGDGWYRGRVNVTGSRNAYGERLGLLALLQIESTDGGVETVASDASWKVSSGPIVKSDMKDGEIYDARLEMPGWCGSGFNDSAWKSARVVQQAKTHLIASMGVPIRRKETFRPIEIIKTPAGETVLDFGQNLAGVVRMKVRGPRGATVVLRHGETLDKDGNFTVANLMVMKPKKGAELPPFQEVSYTLRGAGEEEYEPHFSVHGFRYVKVQGYPGELTAEDFCAVAIYSDMPPTGTFACSDALINQLHHNVVWSMKGNFLDLPTDCPTRERAGWTGDTQIFIPTASYLMDTRAFFGKWLKDLSVEQLPNGMLGNFVPNPYRLGKTMGWTEKMMKSLDGSSGWGDAAVIVPWILYLTFGDIQVLENQYASMKAWVEFQLGISKRVNWSKKFQPKYWLNHSYRERQQYIWDTGYHWGEWLEPGDGGDITMAGGFVQRGLFGAPEVATAYVVHSSRILAQTAERLGKLADAQKYAALCEQVKAAYAAEFIGADGRIQPDKQASYVRVLAFDLAPNNLKPAIVAHLVRLVRATGNHIGTGFLSTPFLCQVLAENGHLDVAYELLNQKTIPSWLYAVTKGATTIWESWEGIQEDGTPQLSLNHYSPGSIANFLHRTVAGINSTEPGYRKILIQPRPGGGLTQARADYASVHGLITSEWSIEKRQMRVNVTIPANTRATISLPDALAGSVTENGLPLSLAEGILHTSQAEGNTLLEAGSGSFRFEYPLSHL